MSVAVAPARRTTDPRHTEEQSRLALVTQVGLLAGPFLSMVDSNIVNLALPTIATGLHTSLAGAQWTVSGYLLALAAMLAASAYLAKRFGARRVYLTSLLGFTAASALCAFAPTIGLLIAARALQGALGAPLTPLAMGMLLGKGGAGRRMSPAAGMLLFLAPALGPTVGGLLIPVAGWPSIFLVNVPFGIAGALAVLRMPGLAAERGDPAVRFDPLGLILLAAGLALTTYGASQGPLDGWLAPGVWPCWVGGVCLLLAYVPWARRLPHPAVDLALLRCPQTALAIGLCCLTSVVLFAMLFLIPVFMQDIQGASPLVAGLTLFPQGIVTGLGTVLGMRCARRAGVRGSAALGLGILTVCTMALAPVGLDTPAWVTALILSGRGLAIGLTIQPLLMTMMGGLTTGQLADGNTLFNVAERLGGSVGIPLLATFFQVREQTRATGVMASLPRPAVRVGALNQGLTAHAVAALPPLLRARLAQAAVGGFHDTIWLLAALSLLGVCGALLLRDAPIGSNQAHD